MNPSLSVILPVHNAQDRLADRVTTLLEIIPDLTCDFEIAIVDDGSTDQTWEVADELSRLYPQVHLRRHAMCHGYAAAVETGLRHTTGEIVLVQNDQSPIRSSQLHDLWQMRGDRRLVMARSGTGAPAETAGTVQAVVRWAAKMNAAGKPATAHGGADMLRRSTVQQLGTLADPASHLAVDRWVRADERVPEGLPREGPNFLLRLKQLVTHR